MVTTELPECDHERLKRRLTDIEYDQLMARGQQPPSHGNSHLTEP